MFMKSQDCNQPHTCPLPSPMLSRMELKPFLQAEEPSLWP